MSGVAGYPTLLEVCTPVNAAAPAPSRHASHFDAPLTQYLTSLPADTSAIMTWANSANSTSRDPIAAAVDVAAYFPYQCSPASRASQGSSLAPSGEVEQNPGADSFDSQAKEGVTMSSAPLNLMSRRATLPFTADVTSNGGGGATTSEGAFRLLLPTLVGNSEITYAENPTCRETHSRVTCAPEVVPGDAHPQSCLYELASPRGANAGEDAPENIPAAAYIQSDLSLTAQDTFTVKHNGDDRGERSAPSPSVPGEGVGSCIKHETRSTFPQSIDLVQPNALLVTDAVSEMYTNSLVPMITSKSAQQPSSLTQLLGSCEGRSVAASVSVLCALHQRDYCGTSPTAFMPGSPLHLIGEPSELKREHLHLSFSPDATLEFDEHGPSPASGGTPTAELTDLSSPLSPLSLSFPESLSSAPCARAQRRGTVAAPADVNMFPEGKAVLKSPETLKEEEAITLSAALPSCFLWKGLYGPAEDCRDLFDIVPMAPATSSSQGARACSESPGDDAASVGSAGAFFVSLFPPTLSKWMRWVSRKYHVVMRHTAGAAGVVQLSQEQRSKSPPKRSCASPRNSSDGASGDGAYPPPGDSTEAVDNDSAAFCDVGSLKDEMAYLPHTLSFSALQANFSYGDEWSRHSGAQEAQDDLTSPWNGARHNSWFRVGLQTEQRGAVRAAGGLMQLRRSITASSPSSLISDASFLTSSGERRWGSPTNLSFSAESLTTTFGALTAAHTFRDGTLQRLSHSLGGTLSSSASCTSLSGDYHRPSLPSSLGSHSHRSGSTTSAIADDNYRDMLYLLFHHPPSSLIGDLTQCYEAYKAMVETSSNGHHVLNWSELVLLLQPEDYIDYRALFPPNHFVTFEDFVEFVEVLSVRYHR
ncbi:hypothetical protein Q4I32_008126 [Leishmania shawi]|uniref:EF-hand domain-containing protein n=1 Tax=Leishmania shawi TaxID=5680 RepID=A0AAW3B746_9TRYP